MKQQTPLQELIDWVNSFEYVLHKEDVIAKATKLLGREREVIEGSFDIGWIKGQAEYKMNTSSDYYEKTFTKSGNA